MAKQSTEVAVPQSGDIVVKGIASASVALDALSSGARLFVDDDDTSQADMLRRVLSANTNEEIFAGLPGLDNVTSHLGESLTITKVTGLRNSDYPEAVLGVFLIVEAVGVEGDVFALAIGSADGIVKFLQANDKGTFPMVVKFSQSTRPTKNGFYPVNVEFIGDTERGGSTF
jgi:hypothetical protein